MKMLFKLLIVLLGITLSTSSYASEWGACASSSYPQHYYKWRSRTAKWRNRAINYTSQRRTRNGTHIRGPKGNPTRLYWADMAIIRRGCVVTVLGGNGKIMAQYDLRLVRGVNEKFYATGTEGQALVVNLRFGGIPGGVNYISVSGYVKELYNLGE